MHSLATLCLLLPSLPLVAAETVLGAYVFHRHGDRTTKAYSPVSLTSLGADQVFTSGSWYRDTYISANASSQINGIAADIPVLAQLSVTSSVDNVLQNSAQVFLQGLYPPAGSAAAQTLADGSTVQAPFNGYQYIPVNAVSTAASSKNSEDNVWLQGGSGCANAVTSSDNYFASAEYQSSLETTKTFYQSLLPVYNATFPSDKANFKNAYAIYDFLHVSKIHNVSSTIPSASLLTKETLHQLQTRADQHEWGLAYNSSDEVRGIAGSLLAAQVVQALNATLAAPISKAAAQRLTVQFGPYGTFMAFFGLTKATAASSDFYGVVDYASSMVFELVTNASLATLKPADVSVRFRFANGTASKTNPPRAFALFGQAEITLPWAIFAREMGKFAIGDTASWCKACGHSSACTEVSATGNDSGATSSIAAGVSSAVSNAVAGVIGALVTLVVILGLQGLFMAIVGLRVVKRSNNEPLAVKKSGESDDVSDT
ncbi:histidine phosphatase superfamily [Podospora didyma]|uniref:Histidine phosphatase superfamily n=1 Tax=Podospora didyma TaxID=330526 RepID=A0AAE0NXE7_9PEZI|nr:histidine phosphatase superfamily [Podospora didyma]